MKVIITFTFCCDNLWKSEFMDLEKPGKLWEFFSPTLWPPRDKRERRQSEKSSTTSYSSRSFNALQTTAV